MARPECFVNSVDAVVVNEGANLVYLLTETRRSWQVQQGNDLLYISRGPPRHLLLAKPIGSDPNCAPDNGDARDARKDTLESSALI